MVWRCREIKRCFVNDNLREIWYGYDDGEHVADAYDGESNDANGDGRVAGSRTTINTAEREEHPRRRDALSEQTIKTMVSVEV